MAKRYKLIKVDAKLQPLILPSTERIVVIGDLHGDYKLTKDILEFAEVATEMQNKTFKWIGGTTHVVQLGDQIDRCRRYSSGRKPMLCSEPNTTRGDEASDIKIMELFNDLGEQALKCGGMVISLLGNHEILNVQGDMRFVSYLGLKQFEQQHISGEEGRKNAFKPGSSIAQMLAHTRVPAIVIGKNLFVHADMVNGTLTRHNINTRDDIHRIRDELYKWLIGKIDESYINYIIDNANDSLFWGRVLGQLPPQLDYENDMCKNNIDKVLEIFQVDRIMIGHTPQFLKNNLGINDTCSGKVIRVDTGSSNAFYIGDTTERLTGKKMKARMVQYLEIRNDGEEIKIHMKMP